MWARNQTRDAERAQDDANFGGAPADGTITFWSRTQNEGPGAGNAGYHQHLEQAITGLIIAISVEG
jgi:hypothetical protein